MVVVFALGYRPPRHPTLPGELGRGGYKSGIYHCYKWNFDACVTNVCKAIFLAPGAPAALASIISMYISMLHHKNSTHFIRKHNMRGARVKTSHSSTLLTPYYAVLRLNMPIRPVHHDERYKAKVHSNLQPKLTTGPSSMTNMLLAERASPWFSFESVPWQAHLRIRHRQP